MMIAIWVIASQPLIIAAAMALRDSRVSKRMRVRQRIRAVDIVFSGTAGSEPDGMSYRLLRKTKFR
jgi:hypothetical protein